MFLPRALTQQSWPRRWIRNEGGGRGGGDTLGEALAEDVGGGRDEGGGEEGGGDEEGGGRDEGGGETLGDIEDEWGGLGGCQPPPRARGARMRMERNFIVVWIGLLSLGGLWLLELVAGVLKVEN